MSSTFVELINNNNLPASSTTPAWLLLTSRGTQQLHRKPPWQRSKIGPEVERRGEEKVIIYSCLLARLNYFCCSFARTEVGKLAELCEIRVVAKLFLIFKASRKRNASRREISIFSGQKSWLARIEVLVVQLIEFLIIQFTIYCLAASRPAERAGNFSLHFQ